MRKLILLFILCFGLALPCFAADGTSFDPTKISVQSVGASIPVGTVITWPSNSWPSDKDNWLECNGQSISSAVYPELVGVVGSRVPDYRGKFLRGIQSGHSVGETVANTLKSHNHTQPTHTHSFSGQLVSTALSGTAAGQSFSASASLSVSGSASGQTITSGSAGGQSFSYQGSTSSSGGYFVLSQDVGHSSPTYYATKANGSAQGGGIYLSRTSDDGNSDTVYVPIGTSSTSMTGTTSGGAIWGSTGGGSISGTANGTVAGTANASTVSGSLRNGNVSGAIGASGGDPTDYTGEPETAPDHIYVRCPGEAMTCQISRNSLS